MTIGKNLPSIEERFAQYAPSEEPERLKIWCKRIGAESSYGKIRRDWMEDRQRDGTGRLYYPTDHPWFGAWAHAVQGRKYDAVMVHEPTMQEAMERRAQRLRELDREEDQSALTPAEQDRMAARLRRHGWDMYPPPGHVPTAGEEASGDREDAAPEAVRAAPEGVQESPEEPSSVPGVVFSQ